jgi:hypothetical protein
MVLAALPKGKPVKVAVEPVLLILIAELGLPNLPFVKVRFEPENVPVPTLALSELLKPKS